MNFYFSTFLFCIFITFFQSNLNAQTNIQFSQNELEETKDSTKVDEEQSEKQKSFFNRVTSALEFKNEAAKQHDSTRFMSKIVFSPGINYRPATSWGFGTGVTWNFRFNNSPFDTRSSTMRSTASYTLKNQIILLSRFVVFSNNEDYMFRADNTYSKFPQFYYGKGATSLADDEELVSYQNILLSPLFFKRVAGKFFVGAGIRYRNIWNVNYQEDGLLDTEKPLGYDGSVSAGIQLGATFDNRDNVLNAFTGALYDVRHTFYGNTFGATPFETTIIDLRNYFKISDRNDVIAVQGYSFFSDGRAPLIELAALGGDQLMRGYYQGRFLGNNMLAAQAEYRFSIYQPFGMVFFGSAGQVYDSNIDLNLDNLRLAYGLGFRLTLVKSENLNIRFDIAKGETFNFYFGVAEAF